MEFDIPCNPVPQHRPRVTKHGTYKHQDDKDFADEFGWRIRQLTQRGMWPLTDPLAVRIRLWRRHVRHQQRGDLTNMVKAIEDVGNRVLWWDDRQIRKLDAEIVEHGDVEGRITIEIHPYTPYLGAP